MYTSDTDKILRKTAFVYLILSILCAVFGAVYEIFSHGVYSPFMMFAFLFPLFIGCLPFALLNKNKSKIVPHPVARNLYHSGIATLTIGSIVKGVLDIYDTTNHLSNYYWIVGNTFVISGIIASILLHTKKRQ